MASRIRARIQNKIINFKLWEGELDENDILNLTDPDRILDGSAITSLQHHPILISKFNVLIGEEAQRSFLPTAVLSNPTAISEKEEAMAQQLNAKILQILNDEKTSDEQKKALMDKERRRLKTSFQDQREIRANRIIRYLYQRLRLVKKFNDGFKNALLSAEEIYDTDPIGREPNLEVLNPVNVITMMDGGSNNIEDADVIVVYNYRSIGQIIDRHYHRLTKKQIEHLESNNIGYDASIRGSDFVGPREPYILGTALESDDRMMHSTINLYEALAGHSGNPFGPTFDSAGNIRELKVCIRSRKKMLKVIYPNPTTGEEECIYMPETYIVDESKGESAKEEWINWWWTYYKIGDNIYFGFPNEVQYTHLGNPSLSSPGIIGCIYNTNGGRGVSMMDQTKSYQYMYNLVWDRLRDALNSWWGPILEMDDSKKPDNWSFEKWMFYARKMKVLRVDSFNTKSEGIGKGKMAGNYNTTGRMLYSDIGNYIQQLTNILSFIELQVAIVTGVTKQREGQVKERETASGVQQSLMQSTSITEPLFLQHEEVKLRVVTHLVEQTKFLWKDKKFQAQYVLDNGSLEMFDVDGDEHAECNYDIHITNGIAAKKLDNVIEQLGHASLQNEKANLATIIDLFASASIAEKRAVLLAHEDEMAEQVQANHERAKELQQMQIDAEKEKRLEQRIDSRWETMYKGSVDIEKALIQAESFGNVENDRDIDALVAKRNKLMEDMKDMDEKLRNANRELERKKSQTKSK